MTKYHILGRGSARDLVRTINIMILRLLCFMSSMGNEVKKECVDHVLEKQIRLTSVVSTSALAEIPRHLSLNTNSRIVT